MTLRGVTRLLFGALCGLLAFVAAAAPSQAACIPTLQWHGHQFRGAGDLEGVTVGAPLGEQARIPGCNDVITNGKPANEPTTKHAARRVEGVTPAVALVVRDRVWFNVATFPSLASHPLHGLRDWNRQRPDSSTKPCTITGTALPEPAGFRVQYGRKRTLWVTTTADAEVEPQRHGTGYMTVRGQCTPSTYYTTVVADRITRA